MLVGINNLQDFKKTFEPIINQLRPESFKDDTTELVGLRAEAFTFFEEVIKDFFEYTVDARAPQFTLKTDTRSDFLWKIVLAARITPHGTQALFKRATAERNLRQRSYPIVVSPFYKFEFVLDQVVLTISA